MDPSPGGDLDPLRGELRSEPPPPSEMMDPRRLIVSSIVGIVLVMLFVGAFGYFFREPLIRVSRAFVGALGGPGVMVGFFLPDAFTLPLPNDVFTVLGLKGGLSFTETVAWATAGSLAGGTVGYGIGNRLRTTAFVRNFFEQRGRGVQATMNRYGVRAVAVAAITPLPYSIFCWAAGAAQVSFRHFMLASQLRIIRVAGYLYLIELGFVTVGV